MTNVLPKDLSTTSSSSSARPPGPGARIGRLWQRLIARVTDRDLDEGAPLIIAGALIGLASGVGVILFYLLIDGSYTVLSAWPERHIPWVGQAILRVVCTALGVWLAWFIVRRARTGEGQNVPTVQMAVARHGGVISTRPVMARTLASAVTLGSGGSVGSEGPVAVLGSTIGSRLGRALQLPPRHVKILVGCGAAAGIAGAFNAPFAGAFFALEEILGSFSVGAFSPVVISSVVGALTVRSALGTHPALHMPETGDAHPLANAMLYPVLGIACGLASALYSRLDRLAPRVMGRLPGPPWTRPLVGGALTGTIVVASGGLLAGNGHLAIPGAVFGVLPWYLLIALGVAKILATVITLGSGGSGGVFTPALFIGASIGGGVGAFMANVLPGHVVHPAAWALVGMAGLVSGATRAPLTAIFMVYELTNDSSFVVPLMIVSVVAFVTAKRFAPYGLYDGWLAARGQHISHGVDQSVMEQLLVRDALDATAARATPAATLAELTRLMGDSRIGTIVVVEQDGALVGMIAHQRLHDALAQPVDARALMIAEDLAEPVPPVALGQPLRSALARMNAEGRDALPVVDDHASEPPRFVGVVSRSASFAAYDRALEHAV
jgi:CIC family chloride channel protein